MFSSSSGISFSYLLYGSCCFSFHASVCFFHLVSVLFLIELLVWAYPYSGHTIKWGDRQGPPPHWMLLQKPQSRLHHVPVTKHLSVMCKSACSCCTPTELYVCKWAGYCTQSVSKIFCKKHWYWNQSSVSHWNRIKMFTVSNKLCITGILTNANILT